MDSTGKNQLFVAALGEQYGQGDRHQRAVTLAYDYRNSRIRRVWRIHRTRRNFCLASSKGKLRIYAGENFDLVKEIDFHGDVDNLRATMRRLTGFTLGLAKTRPAQSAWWMRRPTSACPPEEYKLGAHPESFQLETPGPNIYVQLPDLTQIAVINRKTGAFARWPMTLEHKVPMALDETDHRLFVATHEPAHMAVFDTNTGHTVAEFPCVQDADDVYYDSGRKRIYIPGGEGYISVFQQTDADHYQLLAKVPSTLGARTAGYFGKGHKGFDRFFLGVPPRADHGAEIWIYTVWD